MAIKAKIKFNANIPFPLEQKLMNKFGFRIAQRAGREWFIVEKIRSGIQGKHLEVLVNGELPEEIQNNLRKRCNTIVNHFNDPDAHKDVIENRLKVVASLLPPRQKQFILDWIKNNVNDDDDDNGIGD